MTRRIPKAVVQRLLWRRPLEKGDGQRGNCRSGNNSAKGFVALESGIDAADDTANTNSRRRHQTCHTLDEYESIDTTLLFAACLRLDLRLLKNPIHAIRTNRMQTLNSGDRKQRGIRVVVLNNHLGTTATLNVCGCLPTHVSVAYSARDQRLKNRRAGAPHPSQTRADLADSDDAQAQYPALQQHRAASFSDDQSYVHDSRVFFQADENCLGSTVSTRLGETLVETRRVFSHQFTELRNSPQRQRIVRPNA